MREPGSTGEHQAQAMFGTGRRALAFYNKQMLDYLNGPMRDFIAQRDFVFISTAGSSGECDCSFRAGPRGFVQSLNDRTLIYPEYRGNGVLASVGNTTGMVRPAQTSQREGLVPRRRSGSISCSAPPSFAVRICLA